MDNVNNQLLTVNQVCVRLSITRQTLIKIIKAGNLKAVRISPRTIRITEQSLNELISRGMQ